MAAAVDGGAGIVQLREKHMGQADFLAEAERFVALCREKGAVSIINDNVEIAAQTGADGVHVGQEDLEAGRTRELLGPDKLIGVSAHPWKRPWPPRRRGRTTWAWTAQNTTGVTMVTNTPPEMLAAQIDAVFEDIPPVAVKIGMVSSAELITVIADRLTAHNAKNVVLDASGGGHCRRRGDLEGPRTDGLRCDDVSGGGGGAPLYH